MLVAGVAAPGGEALGGEQILQLLLGQVATPVALAAAAIGIESGAENLRACVIGNFFYRTQMTPMQVLVFTAGAAEILNGDMLHAVAEPGFADGEDSGIGGNLFLFTLTPIILL
ncbi:hypothetical protein [Microbulbifer sp. 2201CG32-9]|uniref:hypothetical protein n=1 Tax=unclassified Microbulbifer TaxID=2619833 RepID=UPI00345BFBF8